MLDLDEDQFMTQYVTTFLAQHAVNWHRDLQDEGDNRRLAMNRMHTPVADAVYMARIAWHRLMEYGIGPRQYHGVK
jgi:hypothetical protein